MWVSHFVFCSLIIFIYILSTPSYFLVDGSTELLVQVYREKFSSYIGSFKNIFYWLCYYSCPIFFLSFIPLHPAPSLPQHSLTLVHVHGSYLYVISLASPFPILFLTFPCLFCTYHLCFLFSVPFFPNLPHPLPLC